MKRRRKPMHRVLIVSSGSLLGQGVVRLLAEQAGLHISGGLYTGEATLLEDVVQARPDVILLDGTIPLAIPHLFELLETIPSLPAVRVIVLQRDSHLADVYEKQGGVYAQRSIKLAESADLLALIRG